MEVPAKLRPALVGIRYWLFALLFLATSTLLVSCGNNATVTIQKGPETITIVVSSDTTHPNEAVTVTAALVDDEGKPITGTTVEFSLTNNNSVGSLSAFSAVTDLNGKAEITYTAGLISNVTDRITATVTLKGADLELVKSAFVDIGVEPVLVGSIALSSGTASLVADGTNQTAVRATVLDVNGFPVVGSAVTFSTTLGTIIGSPASTNVDGIAQVTLKTGTTVGTAIVTGTVVGFSEQVQVAFLADAPDELTITVSPSTITPLDTSTVIIMVRDGSNNPVENETVIFSIDTNNSGGSFSALTAVTDINGQATVNYTAGAVEGTDTIRVRTSSNGLFKTKDIKVETTSGSIVVGSISLTAGATSLRANNWDFTTLRATVLNTNGLPVPNIDVAFSSTLGTITGSPATTNSNGIAQVTLKAGNIAGTATIYAMSGGFITQITLPFTPGAPDDVTIYLSPAAINPLGVTTVIVTVEDLLNNRVPDEQVIFSIDENDSGGSFAALTGTTDVNGQVFITYTAGGEEGTDVIRARTASNGKFDTANISVTGEVGGIGSISISAGALTLVADGSMETAIRATVLDTHGNPVVTSVAFSTTLGGVSPTPTDSDTNGVAETKLTAGTQAGTATVYASAGGFIAQIEIEFVAIPPDTVVVVALPDSIVPFATSQITATVEDVNNNPIVGETVIFSIISAAPDNGSISPISAVTDLNGQAKTTYTAGGTPGTDTIQARAQSNGKTGTDVITVSDANIGSITVAAAASTLIARSTSPPSTTIRATVRDTGAQLVEGATVTFTTTAGTLSGCDAAPPPCEKITEANGVAEVILTSDTNLGLVTITAETGGFYANTTVTFIAGPPDTIELSADPVNLTADGYSTSEVRAYVIDADDHPVKDGEVITFSVSAGPGTIAPFTAATVDGFATVTYTAGITTGNVDIGAEGTDPDVDSGTTGNALITLIDEYVAKVVLVADSDTILADGVDGTLVTATVTNLDGLPVKDGTDVSFSTTGGDIDITQGGVQGTFVAKTTGGVASAFLRSSTTAGQHFVTATAGGISQLVAVEFLPGPPDTSGGIAIAYSANPIAANGTSTSTISVTVEDVNNNPVADGTVVGFTTSNGTLSAATAPTVGGVASVVITSSLIVDPSVDITVEVLGETVSDSTLAFSLNADSNASAIELTLSATSMPIESPAGITPIVITATVRNPAGELIPDCTGNITFVIVSGGPTGAKIDNSTTPVTKSTVDGVAFVSLTPGTGSGTVRVSAAVTKQNDCSTTLSPAPTAVTTPIVIASGPAANLILYTTYELAENGDGSISMDLSALVQDAAGNPVEDGTAVYFTLAECTSDTYLICNTLVYGVICPSAFTGDPEMNASCGPGGGTTMKGVTHSKLTWIPEGIGLYYKVTANTLPGGSATTDTLTGVYEPYGTVTLDATLVPPGPFQAFAVPVAWAEMTYAGSFFTTPLDDQLVTFTTSSGVVTFPAGNTDTTGDGTNPSGFAQADVIISNCSNLTINPTITATSVSGIGTYSDTVNLEIGPSNQSAGYSLTFGPGYTVNFTDNSTPQSGTFVTTWNWDFGDGSCPAAPECDDMDPTHVYAGVGPYTVTLTITSFGGCVSSVAPVIIAPTP